MSADELVVRPAGQVDLPAIWPLVREFATSFEPEIDAFERSFGALIAREDTLLIAAQSGDVVVGYLLASYHDTCFANGPVAWVEELMVSEHARRRGVGAALMTEAERWAQQVPAAYIALATRRAADFYTALGYEDSATFFRKPLPRAKNR
jgi:GNAT superfamily N-acetyltransferase